MSDNQDWWKQSYWGQGGLGAQGAGLMNQLEPGKIYQGPVFPAPARCDIQNTGELIWGGRNDDINVVIEASAELVKEYILNMVCTGFYIERKKVTGLGPTAELRLLKFDPMSRCFLLGFHDPDVEHEFPEGCPPVKAIIGWEDGVDPTTDELLSSEAGRAKRARKAS